MGLKTFLIQKKRNETENQAEKELINSGKRLKMEKVKIVKK
jgi:hypothetical protein